jgi:hypothetical protein
VTIYHIRMLTRTVKAMQNHLSLESYSRSSMVTTLWDYVATSINVIFDATIMRKKNFKHRTSSSSESFHQYCGQKCYACDESYTKVLTAELSQSFMT